MESLLKFLDNLENLIWDKIWGEGSVSPKKHINLVMVNILEEKTFFCFFKKGFQELISLITHFNVAPERVEEFLWSHLIYQVNRDGLKINE